MKTELNANQTKEDEMNIYGSEDNLEQWYERHDQEMSKIVSRTPGPWEFALGYDNTDGDLSLGGIIGADGTHIARIWNDQDNAKADAQFIITACNAHEELVALLDDAVTGRYAISPDWYTRASALLASLKKGA